MYPDYEPNAASAIIYLAQRLPEWLDTLSTFPDTMACETDDLSMQRMFKGLVVSVQEAGWQLAKVSRTRQETKFRQLIEVDAQENRNTSVDADQFGELSKKMAELRDIFQNASSWLHTGKSCTIGETKNIIKEIQGLVPQPAQVAPT